MDSLKAGINDFFCGIGPDHEQGNFAFVACAGPPYEGLPDLVSSFDCKNSAVFPGFDKSVNHVRPMAPGIIKGPKKDFFKMGYKVTLKGGL